MSYTTNCDDCGMEGTVSTEKGEMVTGTKLVRTVTDEYEKAGLKSQYDEDEAEREKAKKRMEHIKQWNHYCPDCAEKRGL